MEIETMSLAGLVSTIHTVSIALAGRDPLHPNVPYVAGAVVRCIQVDRPGGRRVFGMVKQFQSNTAGISAEDGEINSASAFLGSQGQRRTRANVRAPGDLGDVLLQLALGLVLHRCQRIRSDSNGTVAPER